MGLLFRESDGIRERLFKRLDAYRDGRAALSGVKSYLFRLAGRYGETYLLNSLYFYL